MMGVERHARQKRMSKVVCSGRSSLSHCTVSAWWRFSTIIIKLGGLSPCFVDEELSVQRGRPTCLWSHNLQMSECSNFTYAFCRRS